MNSTYCTVNHPAVQLRLLQKYSFRLKLYSISRQNNSDCNHCIHELLNLILTKMYLLLTLAFYMTITARWNRGRSDISHICIRPSHIGSEVVTGNTCQSLTVLLLLLFMRHMEEKKKKSKKEKRPRKQCLNHLLIPLFHSPSLFFFLYAFGDALVTIIHRALL